MVVARALYATLVLAACVGVVHLLTVSGDVIGEIILADGSRGVQFQTKCVLLISIDDDIYLTNIINVTDSGKYYIILNMKFFLLFALLIPAWCHGVFSFVCAANPCVMSWSLLPA